MKTQRNAKSPVILDVRPIVEEDLDLLRQKSVGNRVKQLRDSHHIFCRLMATGMSIPDVAEKAGYALSRAYVLSTDPAIKNQVAIYRAEMDASFREAADELNRSIVRNAIVAERMIGDHLDELDEAGERPPLRELINLTADRYDRIGYGKRSTNTNINVDFAKSLEEVRARKEALERSRKLITN